MERTHGRACGRAVVAAIFLLGAGCLPDETSFCADDWICPPGKKCAARQQACITDNCGNGVLDYGEVCDDGNVLDGDGCSHDCKSRETCGNHIVDRARGEECDDGSTVDGDGCSHDCKIEGCGNGKLDPGEDCDGGPSATYNVAKETAICNSDCTWIKHGDGKVNKVAGEECDGDNQGHGNGHTCESPTCNADCTVSKHGDGKVNPTAGEQCDGDSLGHGNGRDCESATCNDDCTPVRCGDGKVNPSAGEECDRDATIGHDGIPGTDGQSATCTPKCKLSTCGDGFTNEMAGEECDDGDKNGLTGDCLPASAGEHACKKNVCGDHFVNRTLDAKGRPREDCDDGGESATCNANCHRALCGDGIVNKTAGEQCDEGPGSSFSGACIPGTCAKARCGDGYTQAGVEECDEGTGNSDTGGCLTNCRKAQCGDGKVWAGHEQCDDGNRSDEDDCLNDCTLNVCGDGKPNKNGPKNHEACDDGVAKNGKESCSYGQATCPICSVDCKQFVIRTGPYCGDNTLDAKNGEQCDNDTSRACRTCVTVQEAAADPKRTLQACHHHRPGDATGSITATSTDVVGATFTLGDRKSTLTFEFVNGNPAHGTNQRIDLTPAGGGVDAPTVSQIASAIREAIRTSGLRIMAIADGAGKVTLANDEKAGLFGNIPIIFRPSTASQASALAVEGMVDGRGCLVEQACMSNVDCVTNNCKRVSSDTGQVGMCE